MENRRIKINIYSLVATVAFICVLILLNIFARMLTDRFFLRADLTTSGIYTLSDRASEYIQAIKEPVDIIVLAEESTWLAHQSFSMAARILQNYMAESGSMIRVQYADPDLNAFDGPKYNNTLTALRDSHAELETLDRGDIIFLTSRRATKIYATELFYYEYNPNTGQYLTTGINADQALISSLTYVLSEEIAQAVFTSNHQENPNEFLKELFGLNGYVCMDVNLATDGLPEDTRIVISTGPKTDFLDSEIEKLEQFLAGGGNVMILSDFTVASLPVLDTFLEQWGIIIENKLIFDENYTYIPQLGVIGAHVVSGAMSFTGEAEAITKSSLPLGACLPRPLVTPWAGGASGTLTVYPMVQTFSASSYAKDLSGGGSQTFEREPGDETGPFVIAYNTRMPVIDKNGRQAYANLIVAGANTFEDDFLGTYGNSFFNAVLIAGIAGEINPFGENVYIPPKALFNTNMAVSSGSARGVLVFMVIGLPLAIAASGIVVWRKRRNL